MSTSPTSDRRRMGQSSLEFLTMIVFVMLLFTTLYAILSEKQLSIAERQVNLQAEAVADRVAYELDLALTQGDGYTRSFDLRRSIGNAEYNVTFVNGTIAIQWLNSTVLSRTAVKDLDGELGPGSNRITNDGGSIEVVG